MKKTGLIVKSNQVIEAGYELTTSEQRLILSAIEQIPKNVAVSSNTIYQVNARDFVRLFGVHEKTAYRDLKEAASKLYERSIVIRTREKTTRIRWLQMLEVNNPYFEDVIRDSEWQSVLVMFSEAVTPLLSDLKSEFTKYLASDLKGISSSYAIRFYELVKQYESIGSREIAIVDLRFMLCLQDKYPLFGNLQQRVIDPAIREINEKTPMEVQYEVRKTGRKVTHLKLKFWQKKKNNDKTPKNSDSAALKQKVLDIPADVVKQPNKANLSALDKRIRGSTGAIAKNNLASRFQYGNESPLEMMKRIQSEITSHELADLWQNKLESMGVVF